MMECKKHQWAIKNDGIVFCLHCGIDPLETYTDLETSLAAANARVEELERLAWEKAQEYRESRDRSAKAYVDKFNDWQDAISREVDTSEENRQMRAARDGIIQQQQQQIEAMKREVEKYQNYEAMALAKIDELKCCGNCIYYETVCGEGKCFVGCDELPASRYDKKIVYAEGNGKCGQWE